MAGYAIHLAVADKMLQILPKGNIKNPVQFYTGNISPDAIHMRSGYVREYKKHTHMTDNMTTSESVKPENLAVFHQRVKDFISEYYNPNGENADLYKGYVVHVLTDELFRLSGNSIYGKPSGNADYQDIVKHIDSIDVIIVRRYPFKNNIIKVFDDLTECEITDYVTWEEIRKCKNYVLENFFKNSEEIESPTYFEPDEAINFINKTVHNIVGRLTNGIDFPAMFFTN